MKFNSSCQASKIAQRSKKSIIGKHNQLHFKIQKYSSQNQIMPHIKATILTFLELERQERVIIMGMPCSFLVKSIPFLWARHLYNDDRPLTVLFKFGLKCRFLKKPFITNAPLVSCPFPVVIFQLVQQQTHQKVMTGNVQLAKVHSWLNDFLRNPYFSTT